MEKSKLFNKYLDCSICKREIDEITVKLKRIVVGPDTYRQNDPKYLDKVKYEKFCVDCVSGIKI